MSTCRMSLAKSALFALLPLALTLTAPTLAHADVLSQIQDCQNHGGGPCVYDILRELAVQGAQVAPQNPILQPGEYKCNIQTNGSGSGVLKMTAISSWIGRAYSVNVNYANGSNPYPSFPGVYVSSDNPFSLKKGFQFLNIITATHFIVSDPHDVEGTADCSL